MNFERGRSLRPTKHLICLLMTNPPTKSLVPAQVKVYTDFDAYHVDAACSSLDQIEWHFLARAGEI